MSDNIAPLSHPQLFRPAQALKRFAADRRCHHVGTLSSHVGSHALMVSYGLHEGPVSRVARSLGLQGVKGNLARITSDAVLSLNPVPMLLSFSVATTFETRLFRGCEDLVRDHALERESRSAAISMVRGMNRADDQTLLLQLAAAYREAQEHFQRLPGRPTLLSASCSGRCPGASRRCSSGAAATCRTCCGAAAGAPPEHRLKPAGEEGASSPCPPRPPRYRLTPKGFYDGRRRHGARARTLAR